MLTTALFILVFALGVTAGRITRPMSPAKPGVEQEPQTILVKRTRASFRNPSRTAVTKYDEYKTSHGLYAPIRPGKGSTGDEKDVR